MTNRKQLGAPLTNIVASEFVIPGLCLADVVQIRLQAILQHCGWREEADDAEQRTPSAHQAIVLGL